MLRDGNGETKSSTLLLLGKLFSCIFNLLGPYGCKSVALKFEFVSLGSLYDGSLYYSTQ